MGDLSCTACKARLDALDFPQCPECGSEQPTVAEAHPADDAENGGWPEGEEPTGPAVELNHFWVPANQMDRRWASPVPASFPIDAWEEVELSVAHANAVEHGWDPGPDGGMPADPFLTGLRARQANQGIMPGLFEHFHYAWIGLTQRYESLNETSLRMLMPTEPEPPRAAEGMRFSQPLSRSLFDFTANATAMLDNLAFACYAMCAMVRPRVFRLEDTRDRRRVDWGACVVALRKPDAFPTHALSRAFHDANESEVLEQLRALRNLYTHRGSPMVISYRAGPVLHSQNQLDGNVGIHETTGLYFLERLVPHLTRLIESAGAFAHRAPHVTNPSA